jgi:hypothetical protein
MLLAKDVESRALCVVRQIVKCASCKCIEPIQRAAHGGRIAIERRQNVSEDALVVRSGHTVLGAFRDHQPRRQRRRSDCCCAGVSAMSFRVSLIRTSIEQRWQVAS